MTLCPGKKTVCSVLITGVPGMLIWQMKSWEDSGAEEMEEESGAEEISSTRSFSFFFTEEMSSTVLTTTEYRLPLLIVEVVTSLKLSSYRSQLKSKFRSIDLIDTKEHPCTPDPRAQPPFCLIFH